MRYVIHGFLVNIFNKSLLKGGVHLFDLFDPSFFSRASNKWDQGYWKKSLQSETVDTRSSTSVLVFGICFI